MRFQTIILFFLFTTGGYFAWSQPYPSDGGLFEVDQKEGCAPLTVTLTPIPPVACNGSTGCDMDYEGNNTFQLNTFTYTYTQPGTYTLRVLTQSSGNDQITITVHRNIQPEFEIYSCGGNGVQIKVTDTNYDEYLVDFNSDGTAEATVSTGATSSFNYGAPGSRNITVRGRNNAAADNCNAMVKNVNVLTTLPAPVITQLNVLDAAQIQLYFDTEENILYKLQIAVNGTSFQNLRDVYNTGTVVISNNLQTDDRYYCFRLGAYDPCNGTTVYSNTICSATFDAAAQNNLNRLSWTTNATGVSDFGVIKNGVTLPPVPSTSNTLDDTDVNCGTIYCYALVTRYPNGSLAFSTERCLTAISNDTPMPATDISAVVGENGVTLSWLQDPAFTAAEYTILKSADGGFTPLGTSPGPSYSDATYAPGSGACYKVAYSDVCGNVSPQSIAACPIQLTGDLQSDNTINLSWTSFDGWTNGVDHYTVEKYDGQGQLLQTFDATTTSLYDDGEDLTNQVYVYRVIAHANDPGLVPSVSNTITIIKEPNLFYPTAFTPNGDGLNDIFKVFSQYTATFEMKIFNRWGEMMFITNDLTQGWDGTYKGSRMPEGTYVFTATITDLYGRSFDRSGTVVLLKK